MNLVQTERLTVVDCANWPTVGCRRRPEDVAAVLIANRVVAVTESAQALGVKPGLRRREAQRRAPNLIIDAPDPDGEARAFEVVLRALDDVTPRIEIEQPGRCSFMARGPSRYFGGDQAMSDHVAQVVTAALAGSTVVRVGTADSRFGAARTASFAPANGATVTAVGATATTIAGLPIGVLALDTTHRRRRAELEDLVNVAGRLGLHTVGAFAALEPADVIARFGAAGARAHLWARGFDDQPIAPGEPAPDLEVSIELDPPVERVDQAAFVAKALADDFLRRLQSRGASCARVSIGAESEHGESQRRLWRSEEAFSASAIAERMRWQLDGWLSGPVRQQPTGGLIRLSLTPDDLGSATGRQLGFWGEQTNLAERAARAIARVQGLAGAGVAVVPEMHGGRGADGGVGAIAAESVDLVERTSTVDRLQLPDAQVDVVAGVEADGRDQDAPWMGRLPSPLPARFCQPPVPIEVQDRHGQVVAVSARGLLASAPAWLVGWGQNRLAVKSWSSPWLLDERWWHDDQHLRCARLQIVVADGRALLVAQHRGRWTAEAIYD